MSQPIISLRLHKNIIEKLRENGYLYYEDMEKSTVPWVRKILDEVQQNASKFESNSALHRWQYINFQTELINESIVTMSQSLDKALGNGIPLGQIVELCGLPGSGRTELCLQLCVCVQIPSELGGLGAEAVYIDTSSNFRTSRLLEIAEGCRNYVFENINSLQKSSWNNKILTGIHYVETFGVSEFCASIVLLEDLLQANNKIKLIVIDNIAFPFKADCSDTDRTGILCRTITTLRQIAVQKNIAVILTNEMTTRIGIGVVGALGGVWAHCSGIRLFMAPPHIAITHNTGKPDSVATIQITKDGIRDCG